MAVEEVRRVALRCDGGPTMGVGHVMRCVALGEELSARGHEVLLWGDLGGIGWLHELIAQHGYPVHAAATDPQDCARSAADLQLDAVVLDGYHLHPGIGHALAADSRRVLTLVDYGFGVAQYADVYVDQNLGARRHRDLPAGSIDLSGIDYALFRDSVRERRRSLPHQWPPRHLHEDATGPAVARVVAVFGGTDAYGAAPVVLPALLAVGAPVDVTVVATDEQHIAALRALPLGPGQSLRIHPPHPDFGALVQDADLVLSASGTSVWELLCMGIPTAVVCVVDNQEEGYRQGLEHAAVTGLGHLGHFDSAVASAALAPLVTDASVRAAFAGRGEVLIDGRGRGRVVDAFLRGPTND